MAACLFVTASVAVLAGVMGLVAGCMPWVMGCPKGARVAGDEAAAKPPRPLS